MTQPSENYKYQVVRLHDEIFHADRPVLVGVDAASIYCYLLESVERRDEDTWGCHLLDVMVHVLHSLQGLIMIQARIDLLRLPDDSLDIVGANDSPNSLTFQDPNPVAIV